MADLESAQLQSTNVNVSTYSYCPGGLKVRADKINIVLLCDWLLLSWTARTISLRKQVIELVFFTAYNCLSIQLTNHINLHC